MKLRVAFASIAIAASAIVSPGQVEKPMVYVWADRPLNAGVPVVAPNFIAMRVRGISSVPKCHYLGGSSA